METQVEPNRQPITADALEKLQRPVLEAYTLPPDCYWSEAAFRAEVDRIWMKEWICVGRVEDVPNVGDFLTYEILGEPVIVARNGEGELSAMLNICRHRGCKILNEPAGTTKSFKCPYHGWMYGLSGELRGAPDFKETVGFDKSSFGLKQVAVEVWEGFIMVNLDREAGAFSERISDVSVFGLDQYGMGDQVGVKKWRWELPFNWKTYVENYIEAYHVPWVHAATLAVDSYSLKGVVYHPEITKQQWDLILTPGPSMTLHPSGDPKFRMHQLPESVPPKYRGLPVWAAYPGFLVIPMLDCTLWHNILATGPETTEVTAGLLFPKEAAEAYFAGDPETVRLIDEYGDFQEAVSKEDNDICVQQQTGLRATQAAPGRFCKHEILAHKFDNWVARTAYEEQ